RKAKREAKAAEPLKQLSAKRPFADVDSSGSDDEVPPIKLLKDVRRRGCLKAKLDYKDDAIQKAEAYLSDFSGRSVDFDRYSAYLQARSEKWDLLFGFYSDTETTHATSKHQIHELYQAPDSSWSKTKARKMRQFSERRNPVYYRDPEPKRRGRPPGSKNKPKVIDDAAQQKPGEPPPPPLAVGVAEPEQLPKPTAKRAKRKKREKVPTVRRNKLDLTGRTARNFPLHRKLRLNAFINAKRADARLACTLRKKFGSDAVLIIGNWSAPRSRFHEPIRGVGMRRMLRQQGFEVYLLDQYLTLKTCPKCSQKSLENFRYARNPRPRKRSKYPTVRVHGLLRCASEACTKVFIRDGEQTKWHRMWNRDLAAMLNFKTILEGLYKNRKVPDQFQRPGRPIAAAAAPQARVRNPAVVASSHQQPVAKRQPVVIATLKRQEDR
ncbi:hypothetical protein FB645_004620, partial [Coemansia sp. IMI 203386]